MTVMMSGGQAMPDEGAGDLLGGYPNFGMSMRFSVEVGGLETPGHHLGLWHSCKGLQVDLNYKKLTEGGVNVVTERLPETIEYSPVTLERPIGEKPSNQVKEWLEGYIKTWDTYKTAPYSKDQHNPSVIIMLLDYQMNEVMSWTLKNARPSKWMGPTLSGIDNTIALETLVIKHEGFLGHETILRKANLRPAPGEPGAALVFQYNPETITLEHASELGDLSRGTITKIKLPSITIPDLTFDGPDTLARCEQLLKWSRPQNAKDRNEWYLTPLIFQWGFTAGDEGPVKVTLTKAKIDYQRFDSTGRPVRATAQLTLRRDDADTQAQQNPTSGGLPGRSGHVMTNGDTMPGIALGTYGNPARWRAVAAANQIDDPLRVRPGSVLLLPSRTELAEGGAV